MSLAMVSAKLISRVQFVLILALTVYLAWLSAQAVWFFLTPEGSSTAPTIATQTAGPASSKRAVNGSKIASYHLFGEVGAKEPVKREEAPKDVRKTKLRLKLKGVFTAEPMADSGAIIEEIGKSTEYYKVGDKISGSATLEEVYNDRVLLKRNGVLEALSFEENAKSTNRIAKQEKKPAPKPKQNSGNIDTPEQFIEEATRQLAENPEKALKSVGLKPSEGGGYVYQGNNPMLSGLNLKKGDVIMSVNGYSLGDLQNDQKLMKTLYEQGSLDVEVQRDGASFYVNYPLR